MALKKPPADVILSLERLRTTPHRLAARGTRTPRRRGLARFLTPIGDLWACTGAVTSFHSPAASVIRPQRNFFS